MKPDEVLLELMKAIDEQNANRIKEVVMKNGWPIQVSGSLMENPRTIWKCTWTDPMLTIGEFRI